MGVHRRLYLRQDHGKAMTILRFLKALAIAIILLAVVVATAIWIDERISRETSVWEEITK
jgi:hypothetical protein